ncbi:nitrilase family protein [Thermodesulfobacteriota bacterium]
MKDIRVAAVVCRCPAGNTKANLDHMAEFVKEAKTQGVAVICFPEMNITGYGLHPDVKKIAEPVPGPATHILRKMAQKEQIVILAGLAEKDEKGCIFACHLVVLPNGHVQTYRKLHIAPPEQDLYTAGNEVPLFEANGVTFAIQLCYDAHFPELSTLMAIKGAEIIFMPHASPRGTSLEKRKSWLRHLPARAFDNGVFIIACNQTGENGEGLDFPGIAMVIGPSGEILKEDQSGREALLIADLKTADLDRVRNHPMRYFLPNRRPDIYAK